MTICCAYKCHNSSAKRKRGVSFHKFPKDVKLRKLWIKAVRRKNWEPSEFSFLCSEHFAPEFVNSTYASGIRLRENAVPTLFPSYPPQIQKKIQLLTQPKDSPIQVEIEIDDDYGADDSNSEAVEVDDEDSETNDVEYEDSSLKIKDVVGASSSEGEKDSTEPMDCNQEFVEVTFDSKSEQKTSKFIVEKVVSSSLSPKSLEQMRRNSQTTKPDGSKVILIEVANKPNQEETNESPIKGINAAADSDSMAQLLYVNNSLYIKIEEMKKQSLATKVEMGRLIAENRKLKARLQQVENFQTEQRERQLADQKLGAFLKTLN